MLIDLIMTSFYGIAEILALGIVIALILRGAGGSDTFDVLNRMFVRVSLPCLVFSTMAKQFDVGGITLWWIFPLLGIGLFAVGGIVAYVYSGFDHTVGDRGVFTASITFHNSLLLPLAFAPVLFAGERLTSFLNLLFLYNILTVPVFFSVGLWMVNSSSGRPFRISDMINMPVAATILGLLFAATGWDAYVPERAITVMEMFGSLSSPLSIIIVGGAIVSSWSSFERNDWKISMKIALLKSIVLPSIAAVFIWFVRLPSDIALFVIMGSALPVGSIIAVIVPPGEAVRKTVAGGILFSNLASVVTVPVYMSLYGILYGM